MSLDIDVQTPAFKPRRTRRTRRRQRMHEVNPEESEENTKISPKGAK